MSRSASISPPASPRRPVSARRAVSTHRWWLPAHALAVYAFLYAPIAVLVLFSFNTSRRNAVWQGFTVQWYGSLLRNESILQALANSLKVGVAATVIATVIGTMAALALVRHQFRGKAAYNTLIFIPLIIPEVVMGISLLTFFVALGMRLSLTAIILAHVVFAISFVTVVVRARLLGFDRRLEEAAMDLGANPRTTFRLVTLPLIFPGILAGALLAFTLSFDDFVITSFVAGVGSTTLPLKVYSMLRFGVTPEVNAISTIMLGLSFMLILISTRLQRLV